MTISTAELQEAFSPVSVPAWARRWRRAAIRVATISRDEPIELAERNRFGVVTWQAPAPNTTAPNVTGDVQFTGMWISAPTSSTIGRSVQRLQLRAAFAPDRSFGSCGQHPTGQMLSIAFGASIGAGAGAYGFGGPTALICGLLVGAIAGLLAYIATAIAGRRRVHGPVNADDVDLLETVIELICCRPTAGTEVDLDPRPLAHRLAWSLTDPCNSDDEYRRLRYQSRMLAKATSVLHRQKEVFDTVSFPARPDTRCAPGEIQDDARDLVERLQMRAEALAQLAEKIPKVLARNNQAGL